jgi:acetyltransferase-like isoleucine patch superfamily enzyme
MKAYCVGSASVIEPFRDSPADCPILGQPLGEYQAQALRELGIDLVNVSDRAQIEDAQEHLIFSDCLYFMPKLVAEFLSRSRTQQQPTVCALKPGLITQRTVTATQTVKTYDDRVEYQLEYVPAGEQRQNSVQPIVIDADVFSWCIPMPAHMLGESLSVSEFGIPGYPLPMTDKLLVQIEHWTNLWMANVCALFLTGATVRQASTSQKLALALKARSVNPWTVLRQKNQIGKYCDIHPTAYLENVKLGDGVIVGAGAVLRSATIGNGCAIGNNAVVELSVLGDRCHVMNNCAIQMSLVFSGLFTMARIISASVCGNDTFVGDGVTLTDFRMDGKSIAVMKAGQKVDSQSPILGCCLGHRVYLGAGTIVAPGRAIPNGYRLAVESDRLIRMNGDEVPGYQVVKGGDG